MACSVVNLFSIYSHRPFIWLKEGYSFKVHFERRQMGEVLYSAFCQGYQTIRRECGFLFLMSCMLSGTNQALLLLLHNSITSFLSRRPFCFAKSSLVHTSIDRSKKILFSCAKKYLKPPSPLFFKMNSKAISTFAAQFQLMKKRSKFLFTIVLLRLSTS